MTTAASPRIVGYEGTRGHAGSTAREVALAGVVSGIIGGVLMAMFAMFYMGAIGMGFWTPLRGIAATLLGVNALVAGAGALVLGVMIHMVASMGWGVLFALAIPRTARAGAALAYGLGAGIVILLVMTFLVMPWADPTMRARVDLMWGSWIVEHLIFGVGLAFTPALRRRFATARARE